MIDRFEDFLVEYPVHVICGCCLKMHIYFSLFFFFCFKYIEGLYFNSSKLQ